MNRLAHPRVGLFCREPAVSSHKRAAPLLLWIYPMASLQARILWTDRGTPGTGREPSADATSLLKPLRGCVGGLWGGAFGTSIRH
jgi:hypothetical protein